ncbi:MAG TPA: EAL domain-containing protein [Mycobacteriales bacterium]|nr:EAL domain-containing protein [Mycobacteriales bacterium]
MTKSLLAWLPRGRTLPTESWRIRHRAVVTLLLIHAAVFAGVTVGLGLGVAQFAVDVSVPLLGAYAASRQSLPRAVRSGVGAVSLMLTSAVVVHLMHGSIEGHFHFFAMIPIVALYEDWIPFGLAVAVVLLHHGLMGTLAPKTVYDHANAWQHPWRWAFVHAAFFAAACVGAIINWRLHERARDAEQELAAQMRHQAHHDALTGLPNRTQLLEHAGGLLDRAENRQASIAVLLIDLDRFKEINDVLGHASGDVLLAQVGPLMATAIRDGDVLARLGGDEFAAVLANADEDAACAVARRLLERLTQTIDIDGISLQVDGSIGIAVSHTGSGDDIDTLLRQADIAMYSAKRTRSGYAVYEEEQNTSTLERLSMLGELRHAIANDQIVLHYQPKLSLPGVELVGVEALARWQHPTRGLLSPAEFIPVAESTGLIVPLTLQVLRMALAQLASWRSDGGDFSVAVNLSPRCLAEPMLTQHVLDLLAEHNVPSRCLELEITEETLVLDPERALATLTALHTAGITISIDDFGTGYSSMAYLRRLPVSELKVDRSFVMGMLQQADDEVLVRSLVELGHNLGLTVVAEGVEDQATLDALTKVGCDIAQGFHLGRPMTPVAFEEWLSRRSLSVLPRPRRLAAS